MPRFQLGRTVTRSIAVRDMRSNEDQETNVTDVTGVGEDDEMTEGGGDEKCQWSRDGTTTLPSKT